MLPDLAPKGTLESTPQDGAVDALTAKVTIANDDVVCTNADSMNNEWRDDTFFGNRLQRV